MTNEEIKVAREALAWLNTNGYKNEVLYFFENVDALNLYAIEHDFSSDPNDWTSMLQRRCRNMQKIDSLYFSLKGIHIFRTFNATDREDMLEFFAEINKAVKFTKI